MYRRISVPNIWREMDQLQREMNRLMETSAGRAPLGPKSFPAINIWSNQEGLVITAEMPGIQPKDIEINVSADTLTLSGERAPDEQVKDARYHRQERVYGKFNRAVQLPFMVDPNKVEAKFNQGVLEINLSRAEVDKPKKIAVKAG